MNRYCDICESKIPLGLLCQKAECSICKKNLCEKCIGHENDTCGDYREVYCVNCWEIGKEYRNKIKSHENTIGILYTEWHNKCKLNNKSWKKKKKSS